MAKRKCKATAVQIAFLNYLIENAVPVALRLNTPQRHKYDVILMGYDGSGIITESVSGKRVGQFFPMSAILFIDPQDNFVRPDLPEEQRKSTSPIAFTQETYKPAVSKHRDSLSKRAPVVHKKRRRISFSMTQTQ